MTSNTGVTNAMQSLTLSQSRSNSNYCYIDCNTATVKEKKLLQRRLILLLFTIICHIEKSELLKIDIGHIKDQTRTRKVTLLKGLKNDASARPSNIASSSCDLDL